jgi:uncharacterized protein
MFGKSKRWRWVVGAVALAAVECAGVAAVDLAMTSPAEAQWFDQRYPFLKRQRQQRSNGFFGNFFDPLGGQQQQQQHPQQNVDHSRAPPPRKADPKAPPVEPTISIVVMGDGMADWLSYGLEDAFADAPEIGVVRKAKDHSGLLRYEARSQLDWWHVARDVLAKEKANYVIMMLGTADRQNIRERDVAKEDDEDKSKDETDKKDKKGADKDAQKKETAERSKNGVIEFRTDRWAQVYARRIDETVAALKSKGVPVFWVGLPSIRGTKSTADAVYLNDLYRARAERAGAIYVDVWDGFVDEAGKFVSYGPDYEGQMRRLRSGDGAYFTKAGARKLAHFVEREIRRYMNSHTAPIALPAGPIGPAPGAGKSTARPMAGPVVPLAVTPADSDTLVGGGVVNPGHFDALANRVLVRGEPVRPASGRADDFVWPLGSGSKNALTAKSPTDAEAGLAGARTPARAPATIGQTSQNTPVAQASEKKLPPPHNAARPPRPPQPVRNNFNNPFGWFR